MVSQCFFVFVVSLLFAGGFSHVLAGEAYGKQPLTGTKIGNKEIEEKLNLAKFNQQFIEKVRAKVEAHRNHELLQQKIRDYPAGEKIGALLKAIESADANGYKTKDLLQYFLFQKKQILQDRALGSISGTVKDSNK